MLTRSSSPARHTFLASQGIVLVLLMVRLVHHVSFQPRLSVISGTLARMLPDLANFLVVLVALLAALGMALCVLWGGSVPGLGTPGQAVAWAMQYFVNGAGQADSASVIDAIRDVSGVHVQAYRVHLVSGVITRPSHIGTSSASVRARCVQGKCTVCP